MKRSVCWDGCERELVCERDSEHLSGSLSSECVEPLGSDVHFPLHGLWRVDVSGIDHGVEVRIGVVGEMRGGREWKEEG